VKKFVKEYDIDYYIETSALTGNNVEKLFVEAARILYNEYINISKPKIKEQKVQNNENKIVIEKIKEEPEVNNGCIC